MSYGSQTRNPWEDDETPEPPEEFPCDGGCGEILVDMDPMNGRIGNSVYCPDCYAVRLAVAEGRNPALVQEERRGK